MTASPPPSTARPIRPMPYAHSGRRPPPPYSPRPRASRPHRASSRARGGSAAIRTGPNAHTSTPPPALARTLGERPALQRTARPREDHRTAADPGRRGLDHRDQRAAPAALSAGPASQPRPDRTRANSRKFWNTRHGHRLTSCSASTAAAHPGRTLSQDRRLGGVPPAADAEAPSSAAPPQATASFLARSTSCPARLRRPVHPTRDQPSEGLHAQPSRQERSRATG